MIGIARHSETHEKKVTKNILRVGLMIVSLLAKFFFNTGSRVTRVRLFSSFIYLILFVTMSWQTAIAIDCKQSKSHWEKEVCNDEKLLELDEELNAAYKNCMGLTNATKIKKDQKKWLLGLDFISPDFTLEEKFRTRLSTLREIYFDKKIKRGTNKVINDPYFPYQWIKVTLDELPIFQYPILLNPQNKLEITSINTELEIIANTFIKKAKDLYSCEESYDDFHINQSSHENEIDPAFLKAHLIGFVVDYEDNCHCGGCHYPFDHSDFYLWDINTGHNIQDVYNNPFSVRKENAEALWNLAKKDKNASFRDNFIENYNRWEFSIVSNGIHVGLYDGGNHEVNIITSDDIEYKKIKPFLKINPLLLTYLPQLMEAGLVSKKTGNQILAS